jgi:hypothetical protein
MRNEAMIMMMMMIIITVNNHILYVFLFSFQRFPAGGCLVIDKHFNKKRQRIFPLASASRPALGPTQPPVQWVPGVLSPGLKPGQGVMLTTHPHLVPRLRMSRSYTSSHPMRLHGV